MCYAIKNFNGSHSASSSASFLRHPIISLFIGIFIFRKSSLVCRCFSSSLGIKFASKLSNVFVLVLDLMNSFQQPESWYPGCGPWGQHCYDSLLWSDWLCTQHKM